MQVWLVYCFILIGIITQTDCLKKTKGRLEVSKTNHRGDQTNPTQHRQRSSRTNRRTYERRSREPPKSERSIETFSGQTCTEPCEWEDCPDLNDLRRICPAGVVRDSCGCCLECGSGPGMPCYLTGRGHGISKFPPCGNDLECVIVPRDPDEGSKTIYRGLRELPQGECMCIERAPVCGNNNNTYDNICKFRNAVPRSKYIDKFDLQILHDGPCVTRPSIYRFPVDIEVEIGGSASFRCEVSGYPAPDVKWFRENTQAGNFDIDFKDSYKFPLSYLSQNEWELPGYFTNAITQMRGGPGTYQLTSWLTIDDITDTDVGKYICRVTNNHGMDEEFAYLSLLNY